MLKEKIQNKARDIFVNVIENRRYIHTNPELSFQEVNTSAYIKSRLSQMGIEYVTMGNTGVVGIIKGDLPSEKVIALRADIDALPILEETNVSYASQNKNVMHACGHDAHTASLLGTAMILQSLKTEFGGTVKLIFQPAEEKLPGGASILIKEGVLENPKPSMIIGQHVMPSIKCGKIAIRKGKHMASMDELFVTIHGKGGHGAQPHMNIDPVLIASHIIIALQQIVSRMANPSQPTVLSFGKVIANGAINVIPDSVYMEGTFRTMGEGWRSEAHERMKKIAQTIAEGMGGICDFNIVKGYPVLINEEKLAEQVQLLAREYLGKENVMEADIWMAAEDFAYYTQKTDACFYLLGVENKEKGIVSSLHTPTFNIDEDALSISTGLMAFIAIKQLNNEE